MLDDRDAEVARIASREKRGSVIAAAGCGKTEQVARATQMAEGRRLILTHTHAGVDALRLRLNKYEVPTGKYRIDTIAGWCLWYSASYPKQSALPCSNPRTDKEWESVYEAAARLICTGAVKRILGSSYSGLFVDEYQDCTHHQHGVIKAIAAYLPVCVFGDPLQAIFDFKGQRPVDWDIDVFPIFKKVGELSTPWRWRNAGNPELSEWLKQIRRALEQGQTVDLTSHPQCVSWECLPTDPRFRQGKIVGTCKKALGHARDGRLVVIGDPVNINARAALAQQLAQVGFSNIEPISCKNLYAHAEKMEETTGPARLETVMNFICACMTGVEKADFIDSVKSHQQGGRRGVTKFGNLITSGVAVAEGATDEAILDLMHGFHCRGTTHLFRREMFHAMRAGLHMKRARRHDNLLDAICEVQTRMRHAGRRIGKRSIGSTLLVKGLEFDHAVIIHADNMTRRDLYVALTRASTSITILSPTQRLVPRSHG